MSAEKDVVEFYTDELTKVKFKAKKGKLKEFVLHRINNDFHVDLIFMKGNKKKGEWQAGYAGRLVDGKIRVYDTRTVIDYSPLKGTLTNDPLVSLVVPEISIENKEEGTAKRIVLKGNKTYRFNDTEEWKTLIDEIFAEELADLKLYLEKENIDIEEYDEVLEAYNDFVKSLSKKLSN